MTYPVRQRLPKTNLPPVDHALKASQLQVDQVQRVASAAIGAAQLFTSGASATAWAEFWEIGEAARRRMERLQIGWVESWFAWARYCGQIEGASTVSKLTEREVNVVNQALQLISEQSVDVLTLVENVEVDVLHWLHKSSPPPTPPARPAAQPSPAPIAAVTA